MTEQELIARAAELRRNRTEPENRVWRYLSGSQTGYTFRRQHVIFPYICDFFCPAKGSIVEIDGDAHDPRKDAERDGSMRAKERQTLRFTNLDVRHSIEGVIAAMVAALDNRPDRWPGRPHPNPSSEGEGLKA